MAFRGNGVSAVYSDDGDVPVSTGVWVQDKRADVPDILKTGNYKLNNNRTVAVAA